MVDIADLTDQLNEIGLTVINFDWFHCDICHKGTSDHEGGVTPTMNHAYCQDCWPKYKHLHGE